MDNFWSVAVLIVVGIAVFKVALAVWLYNDAPQYGENPLLWCLLALGFDSVIIWLVYLFFFRTAGKIQCPSCTVWFKPIGKNCPYCGKDLV